MHFPVLDHVVPAVQGERAGLDLAPHHGVAHQALELQHHGALLGAAQGFRAGLHRQQGFVHQLEPGRERHRLGGCAVVGGADRAAVAVATDHDALHLQAEHGELDRGHGAVQTVRLVIGRHQRADVAHKEELARSGAGEQVGHEARVGTADEQRLGVLALGHQVLEALLVAREVVGAEMPQAQQQLVRCCGVGGRPAH